MGENAGMPAPSTCRDDGRGGRRSRRVYPLAAVLLAPRLGARSAVAQFSPGVARGCAPALFGTTAFVAAGLADRGRLPPARGRRRGADRLGLGGRLPLLSRAGPAPQRGARRRLFDGAAAAGRAGGHDRADLRPARLAAVARRRPTRCDLHRGGAARPAALALRRLRVAARRRPQAYDPDRAMAEMPELARRRAAAAERRTSTIRLRPLRLGGDADAPLRRPRADRRLPGIARLLRRARQLLELPEHRALAGLDLPHGLSDELAADPRVSGSNWHPIFAMLDDNRVGRFLRARGYEQHQFGSWWVGTHHNPNAVSNRPMGSASST